MARVIEFYIPKGFREPLKSARQRQRGKVLEFCAPKNKSAERSPFIIWKLAGPGSGTQFAMKNLASFSH